MLLARENSADNAHYLMIPCFVTQILFGHCNALSLSPFARGGSKHIGRSERRLELAEKSDCVKCRKIDDDIEVNGIGKRTQYVYCWLLLKSISDAC